MLASRAVTADIGVVVERVWRCDRNRNRCRNPLLGGGLVAMLLLWWCGLEMIEHV
jgi:hypothetical protein